MPKKRRTDLARRSRPSNHGNHAPMPCMSRSAPRVSGEWGMERLGGLSKLRRIINKGLKSVYISVCLPKGNKGNIKAYILGNSRDERGRRKVMQPLHGRSVHGFFSFFGRSGYWPMTSIGRHPAEPDLLSRKGQGFPSYPSVPEFPQDNTRQ